MKPLLLSVAGLLFATLSFGCGGKSASESTSNEGGSAHGGRTENGPGGGVSGGSAGNGGNASEGFGGSGSGGYASGGSGGYASGGSGGHASGGSGGHGGSDVCAAYDDESPIFVQVLIINQTQAPIHVGQLMATCGVPAPFSVGDDASGQLLPSLSGCRYPCDQLRNGGVGGCATSCPFPSSIELQPGETLVTMWDGLYSVEGVLPSSCRSVEAPSEQFGCDQAKRIKVGSFVFWANAGSAIECTGMTGSACPVCTVDGNGGCSTPGSLISGRIRIATARITLDGRWGLDAAGPAAPTPAPGGLSVAPKVELIFTD